MYLRLVNFFSHNSTKRLNECKLFVNIFVVIIFNVINILIVDKSRVWGYLTDEINSPGRTTHNLSEFWLADSFFRWNHVSAWKNNVLMKRWFTQKLSFITCDYLSIMKIGEEGHETFTIACITLLPIVKRDSSYIYLTKVQKVHFWRF